MFEKAASAGSGSIVLASVVRRRARRGRRNVGGRVALGEGNWQNIFRRVCESILVTTCRQCGLENEIIIASSTF